jgi:hypothetical protein
VTAPAKLTKVSLSLPFGLGSAEWEPDPNESEAAWELYVELVTRIAVQPLDPKGGLLREALSSLYTIFGTTREILRSAGPTAGGRMPSVGGLAISVLNRGLRPFLSKWHPALQHWESLRPATISPVEHEQRWDEGLQLRSELVELTVQLERYALALGKLAGVIES